MKKLLSILGSLSLLTTTSSVVSCSYVNSVKKSIDNQIKELVDISSLAVRPALAGKSGTDGQYAFDRISSQKLNKYVDSDLENNVSVEFSSYFGTDFSFKNILDSAKTAGDSVSFKGNAFPDNPYSNIQSIYNLVYSLCGNGISPELFNQIISLVRSVGIDMSTAKSIDSILQKFSMFKSFNTVIDALNKNILTVSDWYKGFYIEISQLLGQLLNNTKSSDILSWDEMKKNKENYNSYIVKTIGNQIENLITNISNIKISDFLNILTTIIPALYCLSQYIDSFKSYEVDYGGQSINDDMLNHVLDKQKTNLDVIKEVNNKTVDAKNDILNFNGLIEVLNAILNTSISKNEYQVDRIMQILFQTNETTSGFRIYTTPTKGEGTTNPDYSGAKVKGYLFNHTGGFITKFGKGIWMDSNNYSGGLTTLLNSIGDGIVNFLIDKFIPSSYSSLVKTLLGIFGGVDGVGTGIGNLLAIFLANDNCSYIAENMKTDLYGFYKDVKESLAVKMAKIKLPDLPESLAPMIDILAKEITPYFVRPITDLILGNKIVPALIKIIESLGISLPDKFKNINNLTDILSIALLNTNLTTSQIKNFLEIIYYLFAGLMAQPGNIFKMLSDLSTSTWEDDMKSKYGENWNIYDATDTAISESSNAKNTLKTNFAAGLYFENDNNSAWKIMENPSNESDKKPLNTLQYGETLLGYDSNTNSYNDNSFAKDVETLFSGQPGQNIKSGLKKIKDLLDSLSNDDIAWKNQTVDRYLTSNNYKIKNIKFNNFKNKEKESDVSYDMYYKYNGCSYVYNIIVSLEPAIGDNYNYYKFKSITEL